MSSIYEVLKKYYGYDDFRKGQKEIIEKILNKKDVLAIMPTGAGKSICYQIPAVIMEGTTIVVSPLISLMKDQVDSLNQIGIKATYINSTLTSKQYEWVYKNASAGIFKIIYVAPERLETESFLKLLSNINISQIAIDEAHCVSQWGHDFRPSYKKIAQVIMSLKKRPVISAFTATATDIVKKDILNLLNLNDPFTLITSFDRKNLYFGVEKKANKEKYIENYIKNNINESGIIYCTTRKNVDELYMYLKERNFNVTRYHAGLTENERRKNQDDFIFDKKNVMVATNAFGMGIDKSNIRYVIHYNIPTTMENYYQEAGRAGRDGEDAQCIILFSRKDIVTNKYLIEQGHSINFERNIEYSKLNKVVDYCNTDKCLRKFILEYFDEKVEYDKCNNCSNCNNQIELVDITVEAKKILSCIKRMGEKFGSGIVVDVLRGSKSSKVVELQFDKLSTYKIMEEYSKDTVKDMISFLIAEGYIITYGNKYPLLKLSQAALKVLFEDEHVYIKKNIEKEVTGKLKDEYLNIDISLFETLRRLRKEIAIKENIPPFIVFSDVSLKSMCINFPVTKDEMLKIQGIGEQKYEKYGEFFLIAINEYVKENNIDVIKKRDDMLLKIKSPKKEKVKKENKENLQKESKENLQKESTYDITYNYFLEGKNVEEIANIRGLNVETILSHFLKFIELKKDEKIDEYIKTNYINTFHLTLIKEAIKEFGASSLKVLKSNLPEDVTYFEIKYYMLIKKQERLKITED